MTMKITSLIVALFVLIQGCTMTPPRLSAVPTELTARAEIPGMTGVRYVGGGDMTELTRVAGTGLPGKAGAQGAPAASGLSGHFGRW
jgi:hypothetical protein